MARTCGICRHPDRIAIDRALADNVVYGIITSKFAVSPKIISTHRKNHFAPIVDKAKELAAQQIVDKVIQYRAEVNYSPIDKAKFLQHKLLIALDTAVGLEEELSIIKELRGWVQEENKICGNYTQDKTNPDTLQRAANAINDVMKMRPDADRDYVIERICKTAGIRVDEVSRLLN